MSNKPIHIIVGSQMGSSEYVADQINEALQSNNLISTIHEQPQLANIPTDDCIWLICTSTHGAGEFPDNLQEFTSELSEKNELKTLSFSVIGLGDSSYDTYNKAAKDLDQQLINKQANQLTPVLEIDAMDPELPEDIALAWLPSWIQKLN